MSQLDDFILMKLIAQKRLMETGVSSNEALLHLLPEQQRNVCCRILSSNVARLDAVCDFLQVSKQEFVHEAIDAALTKAFEMAESRGLLGVLDSMFQERLKEAGYEVREDERGMSWTFVGKGDGQ